MFNENNIQAISLKLPVSLLAQSGENAAQLNLSRTEYIRRAIAKANWEMEQRRISEWLLDYSRTMREESMRVNTEFAAIEDAPD